MGREAKCTAVIGQWTGNGKVLLETDELIFRGAERLVVARTAIHSARERDGWLEIGWSGGHARFEIGSGVRRWVDDILDPKTRIDKLDVKPDSRVVIVSLPDPVFVDEVRSRAASVRTRLGSEPCDILFFRAERVSALARLERLREWIVETGAIWIITPKGRPELGRGSVITAAREAGLVDVKSARFSDTHTALKLMVPRSARRRG